MKFKKAERAETSQANRKEKANRNCPQAIFKNRGRRRKPQIELTNEMKRDHYMMENLTVEFKTKNLKNRFLIN